MQQKYGVARIIKMTPRLSHFVHLVAPPLKMWAHALACRRIHAQTYIMAKSTTLPSGLASSSGSSTALTLAQDGWRLPRDWILRRNLRQICFRPADPKKITAYNKIHVWKPYKQGKRFFGIWQDNTTQPHMSKDVATRTMSGRGETESPTAQGSLKVPKMEFFIKLIFEVWIFYKYAKLSFL